MPALAATSPVVESSVSPTWARGALALVALAAFGPYVAGSARTEQLAVYLLLIAAIVFLPPRLSAGPLTVVAVLTVYVIAAMIGTIFPYQGHWHRDPGSPAAGVDNLLLPIAVVALTMILVRPPLAADALRTVFAVVVPAAALNAVLALVSTTVPLNPFLARFWGAEATADTILPSETMGRFTGIFTQPAEAGIMYSIAAVGAVHLMGGRFRPFHLLCLALIFVGGLLTVSKVFVLIGVPIILVALLRKLTDFKSLLGLAAFVLALVIFVNTEFFKSWLGYEYLTRLLDIPTGTSIVDFYSAGRWNAGSGMLDVISIVLNTSPLVGYGFAGLEPPYDSQWTESIATGGVIGAACVAVLFAYVAVQVLRVRDREIRYLGIFITLILVGSAFGIPSLSANRVATVMWMVLTVILIIRDDEASSSRTSISAPGRFTGPRPLPRTGGRS